MIHALVAAAGLFSVTPCTFGGYAARCGSLRVYENRIALRGRGIDLHFVVVVAANRHSKEPVFEIAGGPGQSVIETDEQLIGASPLLLAVHRDRDIVLLDQRGTGESHPLPCDIFPNDAVAYRSLFPLDAIRKCRDALAKTSDLNAYGSNAAADDLNELRARLHYKKIVLYGGSYGTTEALVYMRRHNEAVKAALLEGVAPPWMRLPLPFPRGAQEALVDLENSCAADASCAQRFPKFTQQFETVLARSKVGIPVAGGTISFEVFADRMRQTLYDSYTASFVPFIIDRAASGDTEPLGKLVTWLSHDIEGQLALGVNLSVTCSESLPFISDAEAKAAGAGTFMEDSRYRAQRAACDIWNVKPVARRFLEPIRSSVPVLMVNGDLDPAAPPRFGAEELLYLPNGRQLLVPHAGHNFSSSCVTRIELQFLTTFSTRRVDASCLRGASRPPFATDLSGLGF